MGAGRKRYRRREGKIREEERYERREGEIWEEEGRVGITLTEIHRVTLAPTENEHK